MDRLIFEFTENEEMADPAHVANIVASYRKMASVRRLTISARGMPG